MPPETSPPPDQADRPDRANRIAFDISPELRQRAEEAIRAIREDAESKEHVKAMVDTVNELTDTGLDFFFLHPLETAKIGWSSMSAARLGVGAARRGIPTVVRRVVSSMTADQRRVIADFMERILIPS